MAVTRKRPPDTNASTGGTVGAIDDERSGASALYSLAHSHFLGMRRNNRGGSGKRRAAGRTTPASDTPAYCMVQVFSAESDRQPGRIDVLEIGRPAAHPLGTEEAVSLLFPKEALERAMPWCSDLHGLSLPTGTGLGGLLAGFLKTLADRLPHLDAREAGRIMDVAAVMIGTCFGPAVEDDAKPNRRGPPITLERVQRYILQNLGDPDLSPERLCAAFGLSRSRLYRLFESCGGVARYVLSQRLNGALRDLTTVGHRHRHVAAIAADWGFVSQAHFSRAFREEFGHSPREARRLANGVLFRRDALGGPRSKF